MHIAVNKHIESLGASQKHEAYLLNEQATFLKNSLSTLNEKSAVSPTTTFRGEGGSAYVFQRNCIHGFLSEAFSIWR